jgi:hypothetical protein
MTAKHVDMSPRALQIRLEKVAALYTLMIYFRQAKVIGQVEPTKPRR